MLTSGDLYHICRTHHPEGRVPPLDIFDEAVERASLSLDQKPNVRLRIDGKMVHGCGLWEFSPELVREIIKELGINLMQEAPAEYAKRQVPMKKRTR